ncbi:uncharacterized protein LOC122228361 isoform X3 [Panthera leo]|uniref:uncharacterized protein LOC122228361 isoform X3 n=1 Tax=Panthera leo TaxID=9689 RepID=UPI001C6A10CA|nr:uncharacterized protein LOC122228361 isoform X3 [Panthera leo]
MGSSHTLPRCQLPPQEEEMDLEPGYYFTIPAERQEEDPPTLRLVSKQVSVPTEPAELPAFSPTHGFEEARYSEEDRSCRRALVPFVQSSWVSLARRRSSTYWRRTHPVVFVRKSGRSADCANNGIQSKLLMVFGDNEKHSSCILNFFRTNSAIFAFPRGVPWWSRHTMRCPSAAGKSILPSGS